MSNFSNNSFLGAIPPVTRNLLLINVGVWAIISLGFSRLLDFFGLYSIATGDFSPYQLITYMFTHQELGHLFFNMFALFMFGRTLEMYLGSKRYLTYYMLTGIGAGLVQLLIAYFQDAYVFTIGASGSVFGLLLAFGVFFPNELIYFYFLVPIKAKYFVLGYGLLEFFFGIANRAGDHVGHFAHLGGMLFGILLILYWKTGFTWFRLRKKKPNIDRILDKMRKSGYSSLTESERKALFDAKK